MSLWRRIYKERRAIVLPMLVLLGVDAAILALAVFPLSRNVANLETAADDAGTALLKARLIERQARDAVASRGRADQELSRFYVDILPANASAARKVFSSLEGAAAESGLTFQRSQFDESEVRDSRLARMTEKVTLVGEYADIRKFLYRVEMARDFAIIERVALSQAEDLRSGNSGRLDVTLDVATYYLTASPSAR